LAKLSLLVWIESSQIQKTSIYVLSKQERNEQAKKPSHATVSLMFYYFPRTQVLSRWLEKVVHLNGQIARREEEIHQLAQQTQRQSGGLRGVGGGGSGVLDKGAQVPELESILRMPLAALEKELGLSRTEFRHLMDTIAVTVAESQRIERDIMAIEERKVAGDIYIR
jgi:hypothetical protein